MRNILGAFIIVCVLFVYSIGQAEEYKNNEWEYYWEKEFKGEQLTIEEFNMLIKHLEDKMIAFRKSFSKINIGGANFSYRNGKLWESQLRVTKDVFKYAFEYLAKIKTDPNSMSASLKFYFILKSIIDSGYHFSEISEFEKCLNETDHILKLWLDGFINAHLKPLALAKDLNRELYPIKK